MRLAAKSGKAVLKVWDRSQIVSSLGGEPDINVVAIARSPQWLLQSLVC